MTALLPTRTLPPTFPAIGNTVYLTGVSTRLTEGAHRADLGLLVTPANSIHRKIEHYATWGADNGRFAESKQGRAFDPDRWLSWLWKLPTAGNVFAALPDVLDWYWHDADGELHKAAPGQAVPKGVKAFCVGDLERTIAQSAPYVDTVRNLGFPVAIVAQDGLEDLGQLPFEVDAVFVGGSDQYKLGGAAAGLIASARAAGKWTHVGRVNSYKRLAYAQTVGAHSADGTFVGFAPTENYGRLTGWLDQLGGTQ